MTCSRKGVVPPPTCPLSPCGRGWERGPERSSGHAPSQLRLRPAGAAQSPYLSREGREDAEAPTGPRPIPREGDDRAVPYGPDERKGLDYLAARLLGGEDVAPEALEYYGITVRYLGDNVEIIEVVRVRWQSRSSAKTSRPIVTKPFPHLG